MHSFSLQTIKKKDINLPVISDKNDELVSFIQEIPEYLRDAMSTFMDKHPNWDQYRLMQAAISGYLLQKGVNSRDVNRIYFKSMFCKKAFGTTL